MTVLFMRKYRTRVENMLYVEIQLPTFLKPNKMKEIEEKHIYNYILLTLMEDNLSHYYNFKICLE